jgi:hypothetical protein
MVQDEGDANSYKQKKRRSEDRSSSECMQTWLNRMVRYEFL